LEQRVADRTAELSGANEALEKARQQLSRDAQDLEAEVAERTWELRESVSSLVQVCYTIAHDLRAPLRTMQGFSAALLEEFGQQIGPTGHDYAQRIIAASSRMDQLIRDLLTFGRLSSAELPLVEADSEAIVEAVVSENLASAENKDACIEIQRPLPKVFANPTALEQVIQNLLSNALKFVARDTKPKIQIWAEEHGAKTRFYIKDNGIGVDPKYHDRIFHVFERVSARDYPGTGIGLAIVQKAVERMGGRVGLQSEPGKGSCFWVELRKVAMNSGE